ncbi:MAG: hypothetical protein V1847_05060, partial [Candidatus Diapherotrites archaeon]
SFKALLVQDGYSDSFKTDLADYLTEEEFAGAPSWFSSSLNGFQKIFRDPARFYYTAIASMDEPAAVSPIPGPGTYQVAISTTFDSSSLSFFEGETPNAKFKIILQKIEDAPSDNPFYYIPFDGEIGSGSRSGYGSAFSGGDILVASLDAQNVHSSTGSALVQGTISKLSDLESTNYSHRGYLVEIDKGSSADFSPTITFSPSLATPILARIESLSSNNALLGYTLKQGGWDSGGSTAYSDSPSLSKWTGLASTMGTGKACKDFAGNSLFYQKSDSLQNLSSCTSPTYGLYWSSAPTDNFVYAKTVFYTPLDVPYNLWLSCQGGERFYSPFVGISAQNQVIPLNYSTHSAVNWPTDSLQNMFERVKAGQACVGFSGSKVSIWWNEDALTKRLESIYPADYSAHACTLVSIGSS